MRWKVYNKIHFTFLRKLKCILEQSFHLIYSGFDNFNDRSQEGRIDSDDMEGVQ